MGSKLWAVDLLINGIYKPMMFAYCTNHYETASNLLCQLNSFLVGYGEGISDLPRPVHLYSDSIQKIRPELSYKRYYEKWSNLVLQRMGKYIKDVLDSLPNQLYQDSDLKEYVELSSTS